MRFQRFENYVVNQGGLSRTGDAGDRGHLAERNHHVNILQVVSVRAENAEESAVGLAAHSGNRDAQFTVEIARCD